MGTVLYKHNRDAYEAALSMLSKTGKAAVIHPTGTGKSFIGLKLCEDNSGSVICWLSPSEYIFRTQLENWEHAGGDELHNIRFYTYAKLMGMSHEELNVIKPDYIVLDEFHRCGAEMWGAGVQRLLEMYESAKKYYEEHGNLEVPRPYVCEDGYALGNWIKRQRKGMARLSPLQISIRHSNKYKNRSVRNMFAKEKTDIRPFENRIWLSSPTMHGEELAFMREAYETNWMSTVGKNINDVERSIAEMIGVKKAVALASGTSALHLCMKLAGVKRGDKIFTTDMTFAATVNPIVYEGGVPVFIDTEYDTWNMDPVALEKAFELFPDVKVVVLANLYGTPAKLEEITAICKKHGAIMIEDAAESLGAAYKGCQTGSFGTYNVVSFNGNKIITGSSGGMLLTDNETAADKARKWSMQSRDNAPWYQHTEFGYNYRMSNVIAGVVRGQIPHLTEHIAQKKAIYERYKEGFKDLPVSMNPFDEHTSAPNYWLSCLLIDKEAMCPQTRGDSKAEYAPEHGKSCPTEILETLAKYNAEGRPIWKPMHMQPIFGDSPFVSVGNDASADIFHRGLCLPSDNKMTPDEQDKIIEIIRRCFD